MLRRQSISGNEDFRVAAIAQAHRSVSVRGRRAHHERSAVKVENDPGGGFDGADGLDGQSVDGVISEHEARELGLHCLPRNTAQALEAGTHR